MMCRVAAVGAKTLLFATIAAGGGHVATAKAMMEALSAHYPGQFEARMSDYMAEVGATAFDRRHKSLWRAALRYPLTARLGQRLIDNAPRLTLAVQRRLLVDFALQATASLSRKAPDLIVSNHGLISTGLAVAKRHFGLDVPVLTYATEPHNISAYWADPSLEHIIVPNDEARSRLIRLGVPPKILEVAGYPVGQAFLQAPGIHEARQRLALVDRFTCLVALGGEGIGGSPQGLIRALLELKPPLQIVVVAGRNEQLKVRLSRLAEAPRLNVLGFVDNMFDYLAASDVVVGKAGPASVYEALAVGRPVVVTGYAGLNEKGVADMLEAKGLGRRATHHQAAARAVLDYSQEPARLADVRRRCLELDLAGQTKRVADALLRYTRRSSERAK